jgi:N-carbamoyl-L-amino-acid hydrolase
MAFTIGRLHTDPAEHALTKVAGEFFFSLDVRAYDKSHIAELEIETKALISRIESERGVRFELGMRASADPAPSDRRLLTELTAGAQALGLATMPLGSPASHDTATFGVAGIPTAMLFVRNANGSHNPHEAMDTVDFLDAVAILTYWLIRETAE